MVKLIHEGYRDHSSPLDDKVVSRSPFLTVQDEPCSKETYIFSEVILVQFLSSQLVDSKEFCDLSLY